MKTKFRMNNPIVIWSNDNAFFMHPIWSMGWVLKRRKCAHASAAFRGIFTSFSLINANFSPRLLWSFDMWINHYCILSWIELGFNDKIILSQTLFGCICKLKCITFIMKLNPLISISFVAFYKLYNHEDTYHLFWSNQDPQEDT